MALGLLSRFHRHSFQRGIAMPVRRLALVLCTAISLVAGVPGVSQAKAIFSFNGAGNDGGVVWDGDADVGSMNDPRCGPPNPNTNPPTTDECDTDQFSFATQNLGNFQ